MVTPNDEPEYLLDFSSSLLQCSSLNEIYELTTKFLRKKINCRVVSVFFFTKEGKFERKYIDGIKENNFYKEVYKRGQGFVGKTDELPNDIGVSIVCNDVQKELQTNFDEESKIAIDFLEKEINKTYAANEKINHILTIPLNTANRTFGVLCLINKVNSIDNKLATYGFSDNDKNFAFAIANYVSLASSSKLKQMKLDNISNIFSLIKEADDKLIYKKISETLINETALYCACIINLYDEEQSVLYPIASAGNFEKLESSRVIEIGKGVVGTTFKTNQLKIIEDIEKDPLFLFPDWAKKNGFVSMICLPLRYLDETAFGTISLFTKFKYTIDDSDRGYLTRLRNQIAFVIQDIKSKKELNKVKKIQQILHDISDQKDLIMCLKTILEGTMAALNGNFGYIALLTKGSQYIKPACLFELTEENFPDLEVGKKGIAGWVYKNKKTYKYPGGSSDNLFIPYKNFDAKIASELVAPLLYDNQVIGLMTISSTRKNAFNSISSILIETISNETSTLIQNKKFYNAALKLGEVRFDITDREKICMIIARKATEIIESPVTFVWLKIEIGGKIVLRMFGFEGISNLDRDSLSDIPKLSGDLSWQTIISVEEQIASGKLKEMNGNIWLSKEIEDVQTRSSQHFHPDFAKKYNLVSMLCVPLVIGNEVIGVINTYTNRKYIFIEEEKLFLKNLAISGAIALKNAELARKIESDSKKIEERAEEISELNSKILDVAQIANPGIIALHIAHDIRNSLLGVINADISNLIDMLPDEKKKSDKGKELIESLVKKTDNLKDLIDKFVKPKMTNSYYKDENIIEIIKNVFAIYKSNLSRYKIRHELKFVNENLIVKCDKSQLEQAFFNLINNSIFALRQKSNYDRIIKITVNKIPSTDEVEITFYDNGAGIEPKNLDEIFELHFTTKEEGSGVGLAICRRIIRDNHNGRIEVKSEYGENTTFTIIIPIDKNKILYGNSKR